MYLVLKAFVPADVDTPNAVARYWTDTVTALGFTVGPIGIRCWPITGYAAVAALYALPERDAHALYAAAARSRRDIFLEIEHTQENGARWIPDLASFEPPPAPSIVADPPGPCGPASDAVRSAVEVDKKNANHHYAPRFAEEDRPMSAPCTDYKQPLDGVRAQIMSAMSSLNQRPDPLPGAEAEAYVADRFGCARHAMEHLDAALVLAGQTHRDLEQAQLCVMIAYHELTRLGATDTAMFATVAEAYDRIRPRPSDGAEPTATSAADPAAAPEQGPLA